MDPMIKEWVEKENNSLIDAYCRISLAEYNSFEYPNIFEITNKTGYEGIKKYLVASKKYYECIKLSDRTCKEDLERNMHWLLNAIENYEGEVLLLVPIGMLDTVKKLLEKQTKHGVDFNEFSADEDDDYNALLTISDKHVEYHCGLNYIKVMSNGQLKIVEEDHEQYKFNVYYLDLEKEMFEEIKQYVNEEIFRRIKAQYGLIIDDRCFMSAYRLEYHTTWLGIAKTNVKADIDLYDYFVDKHSVEVIQRILELPFVLEHFSNIKEKMFKADEKPF